MMDGVRRRTRRAATTLFILAGLAALPLAAQQPEAVIHSIDAAVKTRFESVAAYTVTEHYAVYRGSDQTHPVAEMRVKTEYRRETGKSYTILSQSGPELVRKMAFGRLLENEKQINQPGNREASWFVSANYAMKPRAGASERLEGRDCLLVDITPRRKAPNLIAGTLWVDARDGSIVQIQGMSSKSPSLFTGPTQMMRQYEKVNGYAMATHARATTNSLFGKITVIIDYSDYKMQLAPLH
jgi:hypothetical protein